MFIKLLYKLDATFSLATLESELLEYVDSHENAKQFNLSAIPVVSKAQEEEQIEADRKFIH